MNRIHTETLTQSCDSKSEGLGTPMRMCPDIGVGFGTMTMACNDARPGNIKLPQHVACDTWRWGLVASTNKRNSCRNLELVVEKSPPLRLQVFLGMIVRWIENTVLGRLLRLQACYIRRAEQRVESSKWCLSKNNYRLSLAMGFQIFTPQKNNVNLFGYTWIEIESRAGWLIWRDRRWC